MHLITQISSSHSSESLAFAAKLKELGVEAHYMTPEVSFSNWQRYDAAAEQFSDIATSSFHTVMNIDGLVTKEMSLHITYAMLASTPIIFNDLPTFTDDVDTYIQRLISSRLHSFHVTNLMKNRLPEMNSVIRHLADVTVDYALNKHDEVLIRSKIRNYLRDLVREEEQVPAVLEPSFA